MTRLNDVLIDIDALFDMMIIINIHIFIAYKRASTSRITAHRSNWRHRAVTAHAHRA